ncbi:hypothetical protein K501DRAFT_286724 [Backusella circina FSU 941]|nr:hypothetical protein K501DRAFT_286724 [Backusella circina FSU 941]
MSSISWVAEKSASELGSLLKTAYKSLKQKERDLLLAAEIGKSLLEQNQTLKSDYTQLLHNTESYHKGEIVEKAPESTGSREEEEEEQQMRIVSNSKAYNAVIESLERKNAEIQQLLDQTHKNNSSTEQSYERKIRKFEHEIFMLQNSLDNAGQRIQELEESRNNLCERTRCLDEKKIQQQRTEDLLLMEELTFKLDELVHENKQLKVSKNSVTEKLAIALNDLDRLRQDFENFELTRESYANLQIEFSRQANHVDELNESLEDHRIILARLRDKGLWSSSQHSDILSGSGLNDSNISTCFSSKKNNLLGELEIAWRKNSLNEVSTSTTSVSGISKIHDLVTTTERNITSFYNAPGDCALDYTLLSALSIKDHDYLDDNLLTAEYYNDDYKYEYDFDDNEYDDNKCFFNYDDHIIYPTTNIYPSYSTFDHRRMYVKKMSEVVPPQGFISRILFHARSLVSTALSWFRFTIILTTAILINLWRGPNTILTK